ncbi:protoglobin domain-containing protein [Pseudomonadota bacterium]
MENNNNVDFQQLLDSTKKLTSFGPEQETTLIEAGPALKPYLAEVTGKFYDVLQSLPKAGPFLEGRVESLKATHINWLESLFTGPFDVNFVKSMYHVGMVHVKVKLPVEFMQGAATLIMGELVNVVSRVYSSDAQMQAKVLQAINSVIGFSVTIMQESYQASSLVEELEKFLSITGMSRVLFNNLALAYESK